MSKSSIPLSFNQIVHPRFYGVHPDFAYVEPFVMALPERFEAGEGEVIYNGRNQLRKMEFAGRQFVVKSFVRPNIINRVAYGIVRGSKAKRSYLYAQAFLKMGIGTPHPVAYLDQRNGLLLDRSYYVSLLSECPYRYADLLEHTVEPMEPVLRAIGRLTANIHCHGYALKDYSRGNILFRLLPNGGVELQVIDLNRMYKGFVGLDRGCKNFCRLPATPQMHRWMAEEYAKARGFDVETCYELIVKYRQFDKKNEIY